MTDEEHQELGAWRLAAKLTGAINEEATCRKTTPENVLNLIKFLRDQLAEAQRSLVTYADEGGFAKGERDALRRELAEAKLVADPDNETPELSLRERIMHIGEQAALLVSVNRMCEKRGQERDDLAVMVDTLKEGLRVAEAMRDDARAASARDLELRRQAWADAVADERQRCEQRHRDDDAEIGRLRQVRREFDRLKAEGEAERCVEHTFVGDCCRDCGLAATKDGLTQFIEAAKQRKATYLDGWRKGVLDANDKLYAAAVSGVVVGANTTISLVAHNFTDAPGSFDCAVCKLPLWKCSGAKAKLALDLRTGKDIEAQFVAAAKQQNPKRPPGWDNDLPKSYHVGYLDGWRKGVLDANDKLYAAAVSGVVGADPNIIMLAMGRIVALLNDLLKNPPTKVP